MKILDRYIIKQFLLTALFGLFAFVAIFVVIDMMENLDDFIDRGANLGLIARYYLYFTPEMIKLMTPVALLLSSLFIAGRMSNQNELTAVKSTGISIYRFMIPLLIVAFVISVGAIYFNGWVVPSANRKKYVLERVYSGSILSPRGDTIFLRKKVPPKSLRLVILMSTVASPAK